LYWELLPSHTIQALLEQLTQDVAFDRSSPAVRESVIRALIVVVDNHLAHATMKHYLPKLAPLIHDTSEKVRLQFATLLNTVRKVKAIKFYQIVPVEALVKALATEKADKIRVRS
jgi:condensin-2 complex subunit G2